MTTRDPRAVNITTLLTRLFSRMRGGRMICEMCGNGEWTGPDRVNIPVMLPNQQAAVVVGGPVIVTCAFVCTNCGNLKHFHLPTLGFGAEQKPDGEKLFREATGT